MLRSSNNGYVNDNGNCYGYNCFYVSNYSQHIYVFFNET